MFVLVGKAFFSSRSGFYFSESEIVMFSCQRSASISLFSRALKVVYAVVYARELSDHARVCV